MVLQSNTINTARDGAKTGLSDSLTHMDFGTGTTAPLSSDTAMEASVLRLARQEVITLADRVIISGFLNSAQGNGSVITEIGTFDQASPGGTLKSHGVLSSGINKTSSVEMWADVDIEVTVTQN